MNAVGSWAPSVVGIKRTMRIRNLAVVTLLVTGLPACRSLGPRSVSHDHGNYGAAISRSSNEQFLQNLVRLRYRESPYFLEVGSVTASMSFETVAGFEAIVPKKGGGGLFQPTIGGGYSNSPTISYTPLQGEDFLRKVLFAVPLESLFVLMESGWRADRVLGICVERINDLENASSASGRSGLKICHTCTKPFALMMIRQSIWFLHL